MTILYIAVAILIFAFLIVIHELGHFTAAKLLGVQVNEFSIGMGPLLWQRRRGETDYSLRAIPVGGFCAMEGEDERSDNPRAFTSASWWRRLIILAAGAFMNFLSGFLVIAVLLCSYQGFTRMEVTGFFDGGGLEAQGLRVGDLLYALDGERIYTSGDLELLASRSAGPYYELTVRRDGKKVVLPHFLLEKKTYELDGVSQEKYGLTLQSVPKSVGSVLSNAWYDCLNFVRLVRMGLQDLLTGKVGLNDMSGPVGIVKVTVDTGTAAPTVRLGLWNVFYLGAFIAVNLAVMNLLPIPALDGGRILCLLLTMAVEKVIRRRLDPKYEGYLHGVGMMLLLALMAYVAFHDVFVLVKGWFV